MRCKSFRDRQDMKYRELFRNVRRLLKSEKKTTYLEKCNGNCDDDVFVRSRWQVIRRMESMGHRRGIYMQKERIADL